MFEYNPFGYDNGYRRYRSLTPYCMNKELKIRKISDVLKKKKQVGIFYIQSTQNNTIITLTDINGNTICWVSSGSIGFKNSRKSTAYAAQAATEKLVLNALLLGFVSVRIIMNGPGYGKQSAVRAIYKSGLQVTKITDRTPIPHNGCRLVKKRRV
jgi:small subunit ribosomal protein S11